MSNIFKYFQSFSNIFKRFAPFFESFQTFSNVFALPVLPNHYNLTSQSPFLTQKSTCAPKIYPWSPRFFVILDISSSKSKRCSLFLSVFLRFWLPHLYLRLLHRPFSSLLVFSHLSSTSALTAAWMVAYWDGTSRWPEYAGIEATLTMIAMNIACDLYNVILRYFPINNISLFRESS